MKTSYCRLPKKPNTFWLLLSLFDCCFHAMYLMFKNMRAIAAYQKKHFDWLKNTFFLHYTTKQQTKNPYWEIIIQWKEILVSMLTLWRLWPWQITARRRRQPANLYLSNKWPSTSTSIPFPWSTSNHRRGDIFTFIILLVKESHYLQNRDASKKGCTLKQISFILLPE